MTVLLFFLVIQLCHGWKKSSHDMQMHGFYDMPLIPSSLPPITAWNESTKKFIPQKLWIAVKDKNDELPGHLRELFQRNPDWEIKICDNHCKDTFMYTVWANTSVAWAYSVINPLVGAAKADIWRYSVLYTYGGLYLDDDSDIRAPLDEVVESRDTLIMSEEGSSSLGDCYISTYPLADQYIAKKYAHNASTAVHYSGKSKDSLSIPQFFHDHTLVNWGIFTKPRHPLFQRTLQHIVEIISSEYQRISYVHMTRWDVKWKQVMCSTGFVLTYTLRELELENILMPEEIPRILQNNYQKYHGNVKAFWTGGDPNHYMKAMQRKNGPHLLKEFAPLQINKILNFLEGRTVMGDGGKQIYLVKNGKLMTFPSYDLFLQMGFTDKSVRYVPDQILSLIPHGGELSSTEPTPSITSTVDVAPPTAVVETTPVSAATEANQQSTSSVHSKVSPIELITSSSSTSSFYSTTHQSYPFLSHIKATLDNSSEISCFGDDYDGTRDDVLHHRWSKYLHNPLANPNHHTVMIFPFCLRTFQLGNTLGYYLNDVACSHLSGSHFLAVNNEWKIIENSSLATSGDDQLLFFRYLPNLIIHSNPKSEKDASAIMKTKCHCLQYCWENNEAPWISAVNNGLISRVLLPAINEYTKRSGALYRGTILNNATDLSTLPFGASLPLIPNVTIQYRCGDNIGFGKTKYGLLPFSVYSKAGRIPSNSRYIYIIADSPTRSVAHAYSSRCSQILQRLFEYLHKAFPSAVIVVKRGGDPFLDYTRIAYSSVVFCSASTFCLWPGIANRIGHVYYPLTPLIAKAGSEDTAPFFGPNFHWIGEVSMIKEFRNYRPWTRLIDDLESMGQ
jgi:mannosyltransferase OCH1-like enzyme